MRKIVVSALVAMALAVLVPSLAIAHEDAQGPPCSDIVRGSGSYAQDGTVTLFVGLDSAMCDQVTYAASATDADGNVHSLTMVGTNADGTLLVFQKNIDSASVCVSAVTTIGGGGHVADRAPNEGAAPACMERSTSPGFGFS